MKLALEVLLRFSLIVATLILCCLLGFTQIVVSPIFLFLIPDIFCVKLWNCFPISVLILFIFWDWLLEIISENLSSIFEDLKKCFSNISKISSYGASVKRWIWRGNIFSFLGIKINRCFEINMFLSKILLLSVFCPIISIVKITCAIVLKWCKR